jgi:hypothetical protein
MGPTPWKDGKGERVIKQEYEPIGLVSAAPMSGDWYHQHFGVSKDPLRLTAWFGPNNHDALRPGLPGEAMKDVWAMDVDKGGKAIPYRLEDPYIRGEYEARLAKEGVVSRMEPQLYTPESTY